MKLSDFDYNLDESLIAQLPSQKRENSRLMYLNIENQSIEHKHFYDIVDLLDENDFLVVDTSNNRIDGYHLIIDNDIVKKEVLFKI